MGARNRGSTNRQCVFGVEKRALRVCVLASRRCSSTLQPISMVADTDGHVKLHESGALAWNWRSGPNELHQVDELVILPVPVEAKRPISVGASGHVIEVSARHRDLSPAKVQ